MWQRYVIQKTNFLGNQSDTPSPLKKEKNSCKSIYVHFLHKGLNDEASEKPWVILELSDGLYRRNCQLSLAGIQLQEILEVTRSIYFIKLIAKKNQGSSGPRLLCTHYNETRLMTYIFLGASSWWRCIFLLSVQDIT